jgi:hypothetical protein
MRFVSEERARIGRCEVRSALRSSPAKRDPRNTSNTDAGSQPAGVETHFVGGSKEEKRESYIKRRCNIIS